MNTYRKNVPETRPKLSAREAVAKYGDQWRLLGNTEYPWGDKMTSDDHDGSLMRLYERGAIGRLRPEDLTP